MIADTTTDQPALAAGPAFVRASGHAADGPFGDLLAAISHEIRTPLTAVLGFCDLMGREIFGPVGDPRYAAYLRHIADGGAAVLKSAEDTLALSALIAGTRRGGATPALSLRPLAQDVAAALAGLAEAQGITIELDVAEGISVIADARTYRQALTNLVLVAVDMAAPGALVAISAAPGGGVVRVAVTCSAPVPPASGRAKPLALSIARALIELDGTMLCETHVQPGPWRAEVCLEPASQHDLFQA